MTANEVDYTDKYSEPRESWTGGATTAEGAFNSSAETDARALDKLTQELAAHGGFELIEVEVEDGVAHLTGEVESEPDRRKVEAMAMAVEGIVAVRNELAVGWKSD